MFKQNVAMSICDIVAFIKQITSLSNSTTIIVQVHMVLDLMKQWSLVSISPKLALD